MNPGILRARLLFSQGRFEDARRELGRVLNDTPENARALALLAMCLAAQKQPREAETVARNAVALEPDEPFMHYVLASVLLALDRERDAEQAIREALRLDPYDVEYYGLLSGLLLHRQQWSQALATAEQGLRLDPEHVSCNNLRAMALVKMGRRDEAAATIDANLAREPENSTSHANMGWTLLHRNQPRQAMDHFREALRLQPGNEWARRGILEALRAHNPVYRLMLNYFLWMGCLTGRTRWTIILTIWLVVQIVGKLGQAYPNWSPLVSVISYSYLLFVLLTWASRDFFNLFLRLHPFGRLALSAEEIRVANVVGLCVAACLLCLGLYAFAGHGTALLGVFYFLLMIIPFSAALSPYRKPHVRRRLGLFATILALSGGAALAFWWIDLVFLGCGLVFLAGMFIFCLSANFVR